jgi:hypothetical protein
MKERTDHQRVAVKLDRQSAAPERSNNRERRNKKKWEHLDYFVDGEKVDPNNIRAIYIKLGEINYG